MLKQGPADDQPGKQANSANATPIVKKSCGCKNKRDVSKEQRAKQLKDKMDRIKNF